MTLIRFVREIARYAVGRANVKSERGASAVEYAIMVGLIAAVVLLAVVFLGQRTSASFSCTSQAVSSKASVAGCG